MATAANDWSGGAGYFGDPSLGIITDPNEVPAGPSDAQPADQGQSWLGKLWDEVTGVLTIPGAGIDVLSGGNTDVSGNLAYGTQQAVNQFPNVVNDAKTIGIWLVIVLVLVAVIVVGTKF